MTIGTILRDSRIHETLDCGPAKHGNFFSRIWSGSDDPQHTAVNPYETVIVSTFDPKIEWCFGSDPPGTRRSGSYTSCFGGVVVDNVMFSDNDQITLVNRLGDKIRGHDFDAANSIGAEGKDALKQIAGTCGNLLAANRALSHGDIPAAAAALGLPTLTPSRGRKKSERQKQNDRLGKNLSDSVLAVQLGALPLMDDIASAADALITVANRYPKKTYTSKCVARGNCYPATDPHGNPCGTIRDSKKLTWTIQAEPSGFEQFSMSNPWDLADLLWNYTTLSFVADWILPLQKFLSAKSSAYDFKGTGYVTRKRVVEASTLYVPPGHKMLSSMPYKTRNVLFTRELVGSLQVPLPGFKPISSIPSWQRALTAVSLLGQKLL